jgi:undecaprenyl-phosphate 4-deoxy-4-formamido-L-arabinose transferase
MGEFEMTTIDISIVVPVYRSEKILPHLLSKVVEAMAYAKDRRYELILVNDASPDHSWEVIEDLAARHDFVRGICLMKNVGQHNATMAGLAQARGNVIVIMDDDLQHPPTSIQLLVTEIESDGYDVCYTVYANRKHKAWKKWGSWFNDKVASVLLDKPPGLYLSSFKALRRAIVQQIITYDGPYAYIDGLILDVTHRYTVVTIEHQSRLEGEGNYNIRRSISLWLKMATSFSVLPLRIASLLGAAAAGLSIVTTAALVVQKLVRPETPAGWTSLVALVLLLGGLQLLSLGIIGEYIGRSYLKLNRKPQYVIRKIIGKNPPVAACSCSLKNTAEYNA